MKKFSLESFKNLILEVFEEENNEFSDVEPGHWIPAESEFAKKIDEQKLNKIYNGIQDFTDVKMTDLSKKIEFSNNIRIGLYLIRISKRHPDKTFDLFIYYHKTDKIVEKLDPTKDKRFNKAKWVSYFKNGTKNATKVSDTDLVDMIKWLKAADRLKAFI